MDADPSELTKQPRDPKQQRSKDRRERILDVARELICQEGSEHLKMSDIAKKAEVSIGSLYQYFPDKRSVLHALADAQAVDTRDCVRTALEGVTDPKSLEVAFSKLLDEYYALYKSQPVMRDLSAGIRADKVLAAIEIRESKVCGALLCDAIIRAYPNLDPKQVAPLAFLVWQLGEETMRLAVSTSNKEALAIVRAYRTMCLRSFKEQ